MRERNPSSIELDVRTDKTETFIRKSRFLSDKVSVLSNKGVPPPTPKLPLGSCSQGCLG